MLRIFLSSLVLLLLGAVVSGPDSIQATNAFNQESEGAYLGIALGPSPDNNGAEVLQVAPNSPAQRNGVQVGDIVVGIGGRSVKTPEDVLNVVHSTPPGTTILLRIVRNGQEREIAARLTAGPNPGGPAPSAPAAPTTAANQPAAGQAPAVPPIPAGPVSPAEKLSFRPTILIDHEGTRLPAFTFLAPVGWQVESRVVWRNTPTDPAVPYVRLMNGATGEEIGILPNLPLVWGPAIQTFHRQGDRYMGSEVHPPVGDAVRFIREILVPRVHPHLRQAKFVAAEYLPRLVEATRAKYPSSNQAQLSAGRARFEFEEGGRVMQQDVYAVVFVANVQVGTTHSILWGAEENRYVKAPKGRLDKLFPVFQTVSFSFRPTMEFYNRRQQLVNIFLQMDAQRGRQTTESVMRTAESNPVLALSKYIAQTNDQVTAGIRQSWEMKNAANDRIAQNWSQAIRGVDGYTNPWTGYQTQLPAGYQEAWVSGTGEYVLSNDPRFDPNVGSTVTWRKMPRN